MGSMLELETTESTTTPEPEGQDERTVKGPGQRAIVFS